jgi:hypothetical protein
VIVPSSTRTRTSGEAPQPAIQVERTGLQLHTEALTQDDLERVTGAYVLPDALDPGHVLRPGHGAHEGRVCVGLGRESERPRRGTLRESVDEGRRGARRLVVGRTQLLRRPAEIHGYGCDRHRSSPEVVDGEHDVGEDEEAVGQAEIVFRGIGQALDVADDVVAEIPYRSTPEAGKALHVGRRPLAQASVQIGERIVGLDGRPARLGRPPADRAAL